jgi:hypothetical protein
MSSIEVITWNNEKDFQAFLKGLECKGILCRHFLFELTSKIGHPWESHITGLEAFAVNNIKGRTLHLERDTRYYFTYAPKYEPCKEIPNEKAADEDDETIANILKCKKGPPPVPCVGDCLYFTTDPTGQPVSVLPGTPAPFPAKTTVSFTIEDFFPDVFYYQSSSEAFLGGLILVKKNCCIKSCCPIRIPICPACSSSSSSSCSSSSSTESCPPPPKPPIHLTSTSSTSTSSPCKIKCYPIQPCCDSDLFEKVVRKKKH